MANGLIHHHLFQFQMEQDHMQLLLQFQTNCRQGNDQDYVDYDTLHDTEKDYFQMHLTQLAAYLSFQ